VWVTACLPGCDWGFFGSSEERRSPEVARGLHASLLVMAPLNAGLDVGFCFMVFMFFF